MKYKNKIVEMVDVEVDQVIFNPQNWRIHPKLQQETLDEQMQEIGWIQPVIINQRTGNLVDGHLRVLLARREGLSHVPATIIDISEEEEKIALASFDSITIMAGTDKAKLEELLNIISDENEDIENLVEQIAKEHRIHADSDDGVHLTLMNVTLADPEHKVELGDVYMLGGNILVIASPVRDVYRWYQYLKTDMYFVPYPNPSTYLAENSPVILGVTPNKYITGHVLDRYSEIHGEETIEQI